MLENRNYSQEQKQQYIHKSFQYGFGFAFERIYGKGKWEGHSRPHPPRNVTFICLCNGLLLHCGSCSWSIYLIVHMPQFQVNYHLNTFSLFFFFFLQINIFISKSFSEVFVYVTERIPATTTIKHHHIHLNKPGLIVLNLMVIAFSKSSPCSLFCSCSVLNVFYF